MKKATAVEPSAGGMSRRTFGWSSLAAGLWAAGGTLLDSRSASAEAAVTDVDILNFALNLEYLEAEFYTVVTTGKRIDEVGIGIDGTGTPGPTTGGHELDLSPRITAVSEELAYDEQQHVILLRSVLGSAAVAKPAIDLDAFASAGLDFAGPKSYLRLARAFEDVGVSAYGGAVKLITDKTILEAAARIALTEAYHAGNIRLLVAQQNVSTFNLDQRDKLPPPSGDQYFTVSQQALAKIRTASQVLAIVYGNATPGTNSGGFFPNGVNGTINTV